MVILSEAAIHRQVLYRHTHTHICMRRVFILSTCCITYVAALKNMAKIYVIDCDENIKTFVVISLIKR